MNLRAGQKIAVGPGYAEVLPTFDFETYSPAGFVWNPATQKFDAPRGATKKGLFAVGVAVYAEHPDAEVLSCYYDLKDGYGSRRWLPSCPTPPTALLNHVVRGGLLEAHKSGFEFWIWNHVCVPRYGWPPLSIEQLRCSMAKARAWALPGALGNIGDVLDLPTKKDKEGERLLRKFSIPRNPTKKDVRTRITPADDPEDAERLYSYNRADIETEAEASARIPDLPPEELQFWLADQRCNYRGMAVDVEATKACISILEQALDKYDAELSELTGGTVTKASQVQKLNGWLGAYGLQMASLDAEHIEAALTRADIHPHARRALEIRQLVGSASVKKVFAIDRQVTTAGRVHDMFNYHGARTGRDTGADIQPQNLPKAGPKLSWCDPLHGCGEPYGQHLDACPYCGAWESFSRKASWSWEAVPHALECIKLGSLEWVEYVFGDALLTISGCIRGLFVAGPGKDLICSDYSSIEAVVTAVLAGEQWRIEAFRREEDIYYRGASAITGIPYETYAAHKEANGEHHPDRQKIGKVSELALGFAGWINAWLQFDKSGNYTEDQIKQLILAWRDASPMIVELWGGQVRGKPWRPERFELFGLEGAAIAAVQDPGQCYSYRLITYGVKDDVLYCRLPSGRLLSYHKPRLAPSSRWEGQLELSYEGWNSNPKMGPLGWIRIQTYGGRLTENVVQATARDFLRDGVLRVEAAGYPVVLRVHDEIAAEVDEGAGSIEEFERLMATPPTWAQGWPIRAAGGWRGKRYRKD